MITSSVFREPSLLPGEEISCVQLRCWPDMRDDVAIDTFAFDLTHRHANHHRQERDDILGEVLIDDVYQLRAFTQPGDVWVDAGCHLGIFSMAAMMHGADVSVMLDMDTSIAWMAEMNARAFLMQLSRRQVGLKTKHIQPSAFAYKVASPHELVECGMLAEESWVGRRSCLKLDVQGAEMMVLTMGGGDVLAEGFDRLVMEWHSCSVGELDAMLGEKWRIIGMNAHTDALLKTSTYIVWAESVDNENVIG